MLCVTGATSKSSSIYCVLEGKKLSNSTENFSSRNRLTCLDACLSTDQCDSVNFHSSTNECEIVSTSESLASASVEFLKSPGWIHFSKSMCIELLLP